ncbi:hypothetical protein [Spongiivirga citrea]|uniref:FAS1 domain-containing protein n=1 Tax=Spongiivirga citrea TaxID=1481457 RepID=A0A6M0CPP0_9FLAO|nr:hypothetical protein [Spongiivirga citrea]NER17829.1 hypothetical protein [Spongiivirga citrea]
MKKIKTIKAYVLLFIAFSFLGCDLDLQDNFTFNPEVSFEDPFSDMTAWEFLQQNQQLNDEGELNGELYNYMAAAVEAAGMIDVYDDMSANRTYLFLNNNAFTGGGDVIDLITGDDEVGENETPAQVMARADLDVLRTILNYHIITEFVDQLTLSEYGVNYTFQTLIPGEDGLIVMRRDERYRVDINRSPAPLPSTATSQNERIRNYNYVVLNGIGHSINDPVRNSPYPAPNTGG